MLRKLNCIASYDGRSINSHVLFLIRNSIEGFERENGKIAESIDPAYNIKPSIK